MTVATEQPKYNETPPAIPSGFEAMKKVHYGILFFVYSLSCLQTHVPCVVVLAYHTEFLLLPLFFHSITACFCFGYNSNSSIYHNILFSPRFCIISTSSR